MATIVSIRALEILDSRGTPTVEVEVGLEDGGGAAQPFPRGSVGRAEPPALRQSSGLEPSTRGAPAFARGGHDRATG